MSSTTDYAKLRVVDLRKELKKRGVSTQGRKSVLIQRLEQLDQAAAKQEEAAHHRPTKRGLSFSQDMHLVVEIERSEETPLGTPVEDDEHEQHMAWSPPLKRAASPAAKESCGRRPEESAFGANLFSPPMAPASSNAAPPTSPKRTLFSESSSDERRTSAGGLRSSLCVTPRSSPKKARVSFGSVEMRKFKMSHGGSTSTPSSGGYPLGLSWEVAGEEVVPLSTDKPEHLPTNASPRRLNERQRKLLLERVDNRSFFEKQASFEAEREELRQLRRMRQSVGCNCSSTNACGTSRCVCYKEGLSCNDDSCGCTCDNCINPNRYEFDQDKIDRYRRQRISEAPYVDENLVL